MIVTIHQPEHFPYMGFFQKISIADIFVVLDNVNYRKNYFQNRNKIRSSSGEDIWLTVPVEKKATSKNIKDVVTSKDNKWRKKIIRTIYQEFKLDMTEIYSHEKLIDINMSSIRWALEKLNLNPKIVFASELNARGSKSELLADLCKKVKATRYVSGPSGKNYLNLSFFKDIKVDFFQPKVKNNYSCLYNINKI